MATTEQFNAAVRLNSIINQMAYGYDSVTHARRDARDFAALGGQAQFDALMQIPEIYAYIAKGSGSGSFLGGLTDSLVTFASEAGVKEAIILASIATGVNAAGLFSSASAGSVAAVSSAAEIAAATGINMEAAAIYSASGFSAVELGAAAAIDAAAVGLAVTPTISAATIYEPIAAMTGGGVGVADAVVLDAAMAAPGAVAGMAGNIAAVSADLYGMAAVELVVASPTVEAVQAIYEPIAAMTGGGVGVADVAVLDAAMAAPGAVAGMAGNIAAASVDLYGLAAVNIGSGITDTFSIMQKIQQGATGMESIFSGVQGAVQDFANAAIDTYSAVQGVQLQRAQIDAANAQALATARVAANPPMYQTASEGINWTVIGLGVAALLGMFLAMKKA